MDRQKLGKDAEQTARTYLEKQQLKTLACNYLIKGGEIDLIMLDNRTLVFIEVRFRRHSNYGSAAETVTLKKQQCIIKTAQYFLLMHPEFSEYNCRFDVLAFDQSVNHEPLWYKDAFQT